MREFGIRRALGAESGALMSLVVGQGVRLAGLGAVLGVLGALAATRPMRSLLYGVTPTDPLTLVAVVAATCGVGLAASYCPRAVADPMQSLREE